MGTAREQLASLLKQSRLTAGFDSQAKMAKAIKLSRTVVAKAESGNMAVPSDPVLADWSKATGVELRELMEMAARCRSGIPEWFTDYLDAERAATRLRFWEPTLFPGLCQTEAYAMALERSEPLVRQRMERQQQVIGRASVTAVIDHRVLTSAIGSAQIMADACSHVVELVESEKIRLHVVPEGENVGLGGGLAILTRNGHVTVSMTTTTRDITSTEPAMVEETLAAFDVILGASLPVVKSIEYVRAWEEKWKERV